MSKWFLKCGCHFLVYPEDNDGPSEAFWEYCSKCQKKVDSEGWERREPKDE